MKKIIKNDKKMKLKESTHKDDAKRRINLLSDDEDLSPRDIID